MAARSAMRLALVWLVSGLVWPVRLCAIDAAVTSPPIRSDGASVLAAADFNGDGNTDLAVARDTNSIAIYLRQADGSFPTQPSRVVTSAVPEVVRSRRALAAGDINADGKVDLVLTTSVASTVEAFFGRGDGSFSEPAALATMPLPVGIALGDFNRDAHPDLAIVSQGTNKVRILLGTADGTLKMGGDFAVGSLPTSLVVGDFGSSSTDAARDGYLDLAVTATGEGHINVLFGDGSGRFSSPVSYTSQTGTGAIVAADLNGDGVIDLATANADASAIGVNLGIGKGKLGSFEGATIAATADLGAGLRPVGLAAADFNGDGKPDLAVAVESPVSKRSGIYVLVNRLRPRLRLVIFDPPTVCAAGTMPIAVAAGDFKGNGTPNDLAFVSKESGTVALLFADNKSGLTNCVTPQQLGGAAAPQALASDTVGE